jgi:hypothetical protein
VLLVLAEKKLISLDALLAAAPQAAVRFVRHSAALDVDGLLASSRLVVLHKAGYDDVTRNHDEAAARRWALLQRLPTRVLLDPLESAVRLADRREVCHALAQLAPAVAQPGYAELHGGADAALAAVQRAGLAFPLLCKPAVACGPHGHRLSLVLRAEGLSELFAADAATTPSFVAQQYVDHGGVVLKAYAIGEHCHVAARPSLPDVAALALAAERGSSVPSVVHMDSQHNVAGALDGVLGAALGAAPGGAVPRGSAAAGFAAAPSAASTAPTASAERDGCRGAPAAAPIAAPPANEQARDVRTTGEECALERRREEVMAIVAAVRAHLGVQLLGVDLLAARDGGLLVVDVNHFSGAPSSVPGFAQALAHTVERRVASD